MRVGTVTSSLRTCLREYGIYRRSMSQRDRGRVGLLASAWRGALRQYLVSSKGREANLGSKRAKKRGTSERKRRRPRRQAAGYFKKRVVPSKC